ncbi:MAG: lipase family alpha/beta hydrolase [Myxococcaceae bacterium]
MRHELALRASAVVGVGRLAFDAVIGLTDVVESMHGTISRRPFPVGAIADTRTRGITRRVYQSIRLITRLLEGGLKTAQSLFTLPASGSSASPRREMLLSVLNGVVGDHLAATDNPLAIPMRFRQDGDALELDRDLLAASLAESRGRVVVLVHGLCMSDLQWKRGGHDHGKALEREHGFAPVYLHYNTGRHVSLNGRDVAQALESMLAAWRVPVEELVLLGHSMGGLVIRSACHQGHLAGHRWTKRLSKLIFLGTPHHGAPLERAGNLLDRLLEMSPYAAPLTRIGGNRAAGITDLRFGNVLDEDWANRQRRYRTDPRTPVPLPEGVGCYAIAASRGRKRGDALDALLGDGLVPVTSALGIHPEPRFRLAFPPAHQRVFFQTGHFDLLDSPPVYAQLAQWLA